MTEEQHQEPEKCSFVVYDGDFREAEIEWNSWKEGQDWNGYAKSNGIRTDPWLTTAHDEDFQYSLNLYASEDAKRNRWLLEASVADYLFYAVVDGKHNLMKLLLSASFASLFDTTAESMRGLHAIAHRSFRAWHGHDAPAEMYDSSLFVACNQCDPDGRTYRDDQRDQIVQRRRERERLAATKEK